MGTEDRGDQAGSKAGSKAGSAGGSTGGPASGGMPGRPVHDPRVLRAIAHPVRNRILTELEAHGTLRAADVARFLDIPANQASFHLRQLAKYGLVEEAPDEARDRRDRVWRMAGDSALVLNLSELEQAPGGRAAVAVFRNRASQWAHLAVEQAFARREPLQGVHVSTADHALRLTGEEARAMAEEMDDVVRRWTRRTRTAEDDPARETYLAFRIVEPYPQEWQSLDPSGEQAAD